MTSLSTATSVAGLSTTAAVAGDRNVVPITFTPRDLAGNSGQEVTVLARKVGDGQWYGQHPYFGRVVFVEHPYETGKFIPRTDLATLKAPACGMNRRNFAAAFIGTAVAGAGIGIAGIRPAAAALPPVQGYAGRLLAETFAKISVAADPQPLIKTMAPRFQRAKAELESEGTAGQGNVRGFQAMPGLNFPQTLTVDDGCASVVAINLLDFDGCADVIVYQQVDTLSVLSMAHPVYGLPGLYTKAGKTFGLAARRSFLTMVALEQQRGVCGMAAVFRTNGPYRVTIAQIGPSHAEVDVCNIKTGDRLQNKKLPLEGSQAALESDAGEWKPV